MGQAGWSLLGRCSVAAAARVRARPRSPNKGPRLRGCRLLPGRPPRAPPLREGSRSHHIRVRGRRWGRGRAGGAGRTLLGQWPAARHRPARGLCRSPLNTLLLSPSSALLVPGGFRRARRPLVCDDNHLRPPRRRPGGAAVAAARPGPGPHLQDGLRAVARNFSTGNLIIMREINGRLRICLDLMEEKSQTPKYRNTSLLHMGHASSLNSSPCRKKDTGIS